jgi:D-alanyl-D-alanine carboxypeptidase
MPIYPLSRREFLTRSSVTAGASVLGSRRFSGGMTNPRVRGPLDQLLDEYVAAYLPAMNAPGMTMALSDLKETRRIACYGYADLDLHLPVTPDVLFQIGSISKAFVALVILQLHDENKIDLHQPILDYLPDLPIETAFGPVTIHHLLTHTSGLPDDVYLFSADPGARLVQRYKPGEHFYYSDPTFVMLGLLAAKVDGRPWTELLRERILNPLGMSRTSPVLNPAIWASMATGYKPFRDDHVYPRQGRLAAAPSLVMDDMSGCVASTPDDMANFIRMLASHGQGPKTRIVSEESFRLMSRPYIKAEEFSPTASYGYGIAVDVLDGHKILRHTGGMIAFASSLHVDLDSGVGAFASVNAMQGYRPVTVTEYAVRLLRAERETKPLPPPPAIADACAISNAADYTGTFTGPDGDKLVFTAKADHLFLRDGDNEVLLQPSSGDNNVLLQYSSNDKFISTVPGLFADHTFAFGRKAAPAGTASPEPQPVVEVAFGPNWYASPAYDGPRKFSTPADFLLYTGRYHTDNVWGGEALVYVLKDQLMVDGTPIKQLGKHLFHFEDEEWSPANVEFFHIFEGKAQAMRYQGLDYRRVEAGGTPASTSV